MSVSERKNQEKRKKNGVKDEINVLKRERERERRIQRNSSAKKKKHPVVRITVYCCCCRFQLRVQVVSVCVLFSTIDVTRLTLLCVRERKRNTWKRKREGRGEKEVQKVAKNVNPFCTRAMRQREISLPLTLSLFSLWFVGLMPLRRCLLLLLL